MSIYLSESEENTFFLPFSKYLYTVFSIDIVRLCPNPGDAFYWRLSSRGLGANENSGISGIVVTAHNDKLCGKGGTSLRIDRGFRESKSIKSAVRFQTIADLLSSLSAIRSTPPRKKSRSLPATPPGSLYSLERCSSSFLALDGFPKQGGRGERHA